MSIVGFSTIRQQRVRGGVRSLKVTARHSNNDSSCYEYTIVSVPRIARCYTILNAFRQMHTHTHTWCTLSWTAGGRQARKDGGWVGGREQGEGREGTEGGLMKGTREEGMERGTDGTREKGDDGSERRRD